MTESEETETLFEKAEYAYERRDHAEAFTCYRKAAEMGHIAAQRSLGIYYEKGYGVPQDLPARDRLAKAVYWLTKAAEQGDDNAQENLDALKQKGKI